MDQLEQALAFANRGPLPANIQERLYTIWKEDFPQRQGE